MNRLALFSIVISALKLCLFLGTLLLVLAPWPASSRCAWFPGPGGSACDSWGWTGPGAGRPPASFSATPVSGG